MALNPEIVLKARDDTRAAFASVQRSFGGLQTQAAGLQRAFAGIGVALGAGAFVGAVRSTIDLADNLNKLSQKTGIAVEQLSALKYAGELSDVSLEELQTGLRNLAKAVDEGSDSFKRLKIDPRQFRDNNELLLALADRFAAIQDGAAKTAIAVDLFGRSGEQLIPLLNQGSAGLKGLADEAKRAGAVISSDLARAAEEFNDSVTRLGAQARGAGIQIANGLLPSLLEITTQLAEGARIAGGFGEAIRVFGTINPFRSLAGNIHELTAELADLEARSRSATRFQTAEQSARAYAGAISDVRKQLEFLKLQQQREALATTGGRRDLDPRDIRAAARPPAREVLAPKADKDKAAKRDDADQVIKSLQREVQTVEELTSAERALDDIRSKRISATPAQEQTIRALGAEIQGRKDAKDALEAEATAERNLFDAQMEGAKRISDLNAQIADDQESERLEIEKTAEAYRRLADPTREYRQELEKIARAQAEGAISPDVAKKASEAIQKEIDAIGQKTSDIGRELGLTFSSALEDAILQLRNFGDIADAVFQDIARLAIRKSITEPLLDTVSGALSGAGAGSGAGFWSGLFGGGTAAGFGGMALGGILTSRGIQSFAGGGIARTPGLAMVRDGGLNEAVVPLPNGRSIPVDWRGGRQAATTVTMNVYAQDAASFRRSQRQILGELRGQLRAG